MSQVQEIVDEMDKSGEEYQQPDSNLLHLIERAASNGQNKHPALVMCSRAGFYGKDLGDAGWGCGYRNAQVRAGH